MKNNPFATVLKNNDLESKSFIEKKLNVKSNIKKSSNDQTNEFLKKTRQIKKVKITINGIPDFTLKNFFKLKTKTGYSNAQLFTWMVDKIK